MEALRDMHLPPGFEFHPSDTELVSHYLKRKILGQKIEYDLIPEVDIYKHEPWDLPAKCNLPVNDNKWHFFASCDRKYPTGSRSIRATIAGYWKSTGRDRAIKMNKRTLGTKKTLVFHEGQPPFGRRTEWIMHEYCIDNNECQVSPDMKDAFVLCRVTKRDNWVLENDNDVGSRNPHLQQVNDAEPEDAAGSVICSEEPNHVATPVGSAQLSNDVSAPVGSAELSNDVAMVSTTADTASPNSGNELETWLEELLDPSFSFSPAADTGSANVSLTEQYAESLGETSCALSIAEVPMSSSVGAMGPLLRKLNWLLSSENQLRRSVKGAIELLKEDLEDIIADLVELLIVEHPNYKCRYWMHEVRELSYHIEDFIDDKMMQPHTATERKMRSVCHPQFRVRRVKIPCLPKTMKPSARVAELRTLLREASERHERYQLQDCVSEPRRPLFPAGNSRRVRATSGVAANLLAGVDGTRGKLTRWLVDQEEQQLKVLSIFGTPGVGKTTLVKELHHEFRPRFECWAFIRVSRNPDMKRLLGEILSQVQGRKQDYNSCTTDNMIDSIRCHLQDKSYFVVIDELWETAAWDIIKIAFPKGNNHSRIIITAEVEYVAVKCCGYHCASTFEITPLGNLQDCGKIFFDRLFGSEHKCPHKLKDICCKIVTSCGGMPLAIITIAGLLKRHMDNTELWNNLQQCFLSSLTSLTLEEMVKEVVNICYDALPQDLKTCMLYLTMYTEGCTISKVDLLKQWIAEGFISPMEGKLGVAESYFNELINRGMIQPEKIDHSDEVLSCTVHHIVFDLIVQKSGEDNFITTIDYSNAMPRFSMAARRLSLHFSCAQFAAKPESLKLSQVRSLAFFGLLKCMPSIMEFKFLRVVILEFWGNDYDCMSLDLSKICILLQLRYLKISGHIVMILPHKMQMLRSLETLEIIDAEVPTVPTDILHLPSLLHLSLPNRTKLPDGIGRLTSLQILECFDFGNNSEDNVLSLGELVNLKNLHVTCSIALSNHHLQRKLAALSSSLGRLANLISLRVGPCAMVMPISTDQDVMPYTHMLLQRLELLPSSFIFSRLPRWIGVRLKKLQVLKIAVEVLLSNDIDTFIGLPALIFLSLYVRKPNGERIIFNSQALPVLKYFNYRCGGALRLTFQEKALPNLEKLELHFDVHRARSSYTSMLAGIEHLLKLNEITAEVGTPAGTNKSDRRAAESALKEATRKHPGFPIRVNVRRVDCDCIKEESMPVGFMHLTLYIVGALLLSAVVLILFLYRRTQILGKF